jgi:PiT family inorganic phosphate transporter
VLLSTYLGTPVSTTHAIAGAITGVGSIRRMKAVRWGIATNIVWAWVLTIPAAGCIAAVSYVVVHYTIAR